MTPLRLPLPRDFNVEGVLALHRRDTAQIAERVDEQQFSKALMWHGRAAFLHVEFQPGLAIAHFDIEGDAGGDEDAAVSSMLQRMLGLDQDIEAFEQRFRDHAQLGTLISSQAGLRVPLTATPFEALTWAITGQQISVRAAVAIRRRLIQRIDVRHGSGLLCNPDAATIAVLDDADLREAGFSTSKAATLLALSRLVAGGELPLESWLTNFQAEDVERRLLAIRGIGPWTVSYALLRGFGWLDGSLHGDVAVRRSLQRLLGSDQPLSQEQTRAWLEEFAPWRALVAAHLWGLHALPA